MRPILLVALSLCGCADTLPYTRGLAEGEKTVGALVLKVEAKQKAQVDALKAAATSVDMFDQGLAKLHEQWAPFEKARATAHAVAIVLWSGIVAVDNKVKTIADLVPLAATLAPAVQVIVDLGALYLGGK